MQEERIYNMITIYLDGMNGASCRYPKNIIRLGILNSLTDEEILTILEYADGKNIPVSILPHNTKNIFRDNFIANHLNNDGFIKGKHIGKEYVCNIGGKEFKYILKKPNT